MSNLTLFNPSALPAYIKKGEFSAVAKALAGSGGGGKRISIKGGVFRLLDNGKELASIDERYLDMVIVNAAPKVGRTFYAAKYDEGSATAPNCWSADGDKPDPTAQDIQNATCVGCPQNIAGSGRGDSRACRYSQRLAVVLATDVEGDVLQLTLPAQSIFGKAEGDQRPLQDYARYLLAQGVSPTQLVTRAKFDVSPGVEGVKVLFKAMRWLSEEEIVTCAEKAETPEAVNAITMTVAKMDAVEKQPEPTGTVAKLKAKPVPVVQEPADDEDPPAPAPKAKGRPRASGKEYAQTSGEAIDNDIEPAPAPKAKKAAPVVNAAVAAVLAEWDD